MTENASDQLRGVKQDEGTTAWEGIKHRKSFRAGQADDSGRELPTVVKVPTQVRCNRGTEVSKFEQEVTELTEKGFGLYG